MPNDQDTLIKETNDLLESAQKEVLQEINTKRNLFSRIFSGKSVSESLKQAQSSISKAINQMQSLKKIDSSLISKLQKHINEKNNELKKLEESFESTKKETSELKDKIEFYETEFAKFKSAEQEVSVDTTEEKSVASKIEEDLKKKIQALEEENSNIERKYTISRDELKDTQALAVEFSARIKKLKAEITNG